PPAQFKTKANTYVTSLGTTKKSNFIEKEILKPGAILIVGMPKVTTAKGKKYVVSNVLNVMLQGWGEVKGAKSTDTVDVVATDFKLFPDKPAIGLYQTNTDTATHDNFMKASLVTKFVQDFADGEAFYNSGTAMCFDQNIIFNAHSPGYSSSVYHELLHTYEGVKIGLVNEIKEGVVDYFANKFATKDGAKFIEYAPYKKSVAAATKMAKVVTDAVLAKAFFQDDQESIVKIAKVLDGPDGEVFKATPTGDRMDEDMRKAWSSASEIKGLHQQWARER